MNATRKAINEYISALEREFSCATPPPAAETPFPPSAVTLPAATGAELGDKIGFSAIVARPPGRPWANEYRTEEGTIVKITRRAYHVRRTGGKYPISWTKKDDFKILAILKRAADHEGATS